MVALCTLDEAKMQCRIDGGLEDGYIGALITAASQAILTFIKNSDAGPVTAGHVPDDIRHACLLLVNYFYTHRDENDHAEYDGFYLPKPVIALLYPYRMLSMA